MVTSKNERIVNLVVCLMSTRQFVTASYLRQNVQGYNDPGQSDDTFKRMLERDKAELREMGIPLETGRNPDTSEGYRIDPEQYALPDITLDRSEAAAVAAAAAVWHEPSVAAIFQTAVLKLQAAGIEVASDDEIGITHGGSTRSVGDERAITALLSAIDVGRPVTFTHRTTRGRKTRTLEPWGIVANGGRWYVTGHDRDRDDTRTFRISRVVDVKAFGDAGSVQRPAGVDVRTIVDAAVERADDGAVAKIWVAAGRAHGLRRAALSAEPHRLGGPDGEAGDLLTVAIASRSGLRRIILSAGADAVVLEPEELRDDVIADLDRLIAAEVTA
ncbi:WYL domain-containing protein [Gordonia sp. (in: high G+C Gram-positive bacteria)]|uniref:helix-turn-helix transcriptional regulator n=1 Tax=Gordonia sp. (in: high G+C Gram-positive bacteria) TaxID=84139 RepID=UPI0016B9CA55|nr:WYL domain-containing protein [Gordonia sp. (in: high G+C Gram-positive bacteria)]NLG47070.1 WYL domain-containing protein [Gordonia sp. (in: high G+C Gram-positive bacteria)]